MSQTTQQMFDYMETPEFHAAVQGKVKQDRQAGIAWRCGLVKQVNANNALEGYTPDAHLLDLQEQFIMGSWGLTKFSGCSANTPRGPGENSPLNLTSCSGSRLKTGVLTFDAVFGSNYLQLAGCPCSRYLQMSLQSMPQARIPW